MTLVFSVQSRNTAWVVVDRRLSYGRRRPPRDTAVKVMNLETIDGVGLLAYAGLGATPRGMQPSDWMSAVLRGRAGLTFEQALGVLSAVANKELPRHLVRTPGRPDSVSAHSIIVPAFIDGVGPRLYTIDNVVDRRTREHWFRYTSHQRIGLPGAPSARIGAGGTGGLYLARRRHTWQRALLSLVKAHDRRKVSDQLVADELARLNYETFQRIGDGTVSPNCIVAWRGRPGSWTDASGGGHQFYTGVEREADSSAIPTIANGFDVQAIGGLLMSRLQTHIATHGLGSGTQVFGTDDIDQMLARLPSEPDEKLR